jgi:hypothetical protein
MERHEVADRVGLDIYTAEEALDDALGRATQLVGALIAARRDARLSTTVGHDIFESLGEASTALMSARGSFVQAHKRLDVLRKALKLQPVASTPVDKDIVQGASIHAVPVREVVQAA